MPVEGLFLPPASIQIHLQIDFSQIWIEASQTKQQFFGQRSLLNQLGSEAAEWRIWFKMNSIDFSLLDYDILKYDPKTFLKDFLERKRGGHPNLSNYYYKKHLKQQSNYHFLF